MRFLTLADGLKKNGASVSFITRKCTGNLNQLILKKGFQVLELKKPETKDLNKKNKNTHEFVELSQLSICEIEDAFDIIHATNNSMPDWLVVEIQNVFVGD